MNKSTPINQLPINNNNQNQNQTQSQNYVSDQQRQFITQAQNAISNSNMPQNTQISSDIVNDDDVIVTDILNQINASQNTSQNNSAQSELDIQQQQLLLQLQQQQAQQQAQQQQQQQIAQAQYQAQMLAQAQLQQGVPPSLQNVNQYDVNPYENIIPPSQSIDFKTYLNNFADDLKLAGIIFLVVILVHFLPIDSVLSRYINLEKIPYHNVIFNAVLITLFVIIIKKLARL